MTGIIPRSYQACVVVIVPCVPTAKLGNHSALLSTATRLHWGCQGSLVAGLLIYSGKFWEVTKEETWSTARRNAGTETLFHTPLQLEMLLRWCFLESAFTPLLKFCLGLGCSSVGGLLPSVKESLGLPLSSSIHTEVCFFTCLSHSNCVPLLSTSLHWVQIFEHLLCVRIGQVTSYKTVNKTCSLPNYEASNICNHHCKVNKGLLYHV